MYMFFADWGANRPGPLRHPNSSEQEKNTFIMYVSSQIFHPFIKTPGGWDMRSGASLGRWGNSVPGFSTSCRLGNSQLCLDDWSSFWKLQVGCRCTLPKTNSSPLKIGAFWKRRFRLWKPPFSGAMTMLFFWSVFSVDICMLDIVSFIEFCSENMDGYSERIWF